MGKLVLAVFTDGTCNNALASSFFETATNVAKLHRMWAEGTAQEEVRAKFYLKGVGTGGGLDTLVGGFTGAGFHDRIDQALSWIWQQAEQHPGKEIEIQLFGFSRGAAESLHLVNALTDPDDLRKYRLDGRNLRISFLGLFDPVASLGIPGSDRDFGARLRIRPRQVERAVSLIALSEVRLFFPLQTLRLNLDPQTDSVEVGADDWTEFSKSHPLPCKTWEEWLLPGVHSDVGGGYGSQEWIPDIPSPRPEAGEGLAAHLFRAMDQEIAAGAAPRGAVGNEFWSREQVAARIQELHAARLDSFEAERRDDAAGAHTMGMSRERPVKPSLRTRSNDLSRIALWTMVRRSEAAGVKWKPPMELPPEIRPAFTYLPSEHPLHPLMALASNPKDLQSQLRIDNPVYWRDTVPFIHDSRLAASLLWRKRNIYFSGRND